MKSMRRMKETVGVKRLGLKGRVRRMEEYAQLRRRKKTKRETG